MLTAAPCFASAPESKGAGGASWIEGGVMAYAISEECVACADLENCHAGLDPNAVF